MPMSALKSMPRGSRLMRTMAALAIGCGLVAPTAIAPAYAIEPILKAIVTDRSVPDCTSPAVLDTVRDKIAAADAGMTHAGVLLTAVDQIAQDYVSQNDPSPYARRYCVARAGLSDGKTTTLYYLVEERAGFVGVTWNVDACLLGYEPWRVHDGRCHTVRHRWW
jgi:hypothetical protein